MSEQADHTVALATKVTLERSGLFDVSADDAFIKVGAESTDLFINVAHELGDRRDAQGKVIYTRITGVNCMLNGSLNFIRMHNYVKHYGKDAVDDALEFIRGESEKGQSPETDETFSKLERLVVLQENLLFDLPRLPREVLKINFNYPDMPLTEELE